MLRSEEDLTYWRALASGADLGDIDAVLASLIGRPAWQADAACRDHPSPWWFSHGKDAEKAVEVCERCLVIDECSTWAATTTAPLTGIYGGAHVNGPRRRKAA